MKDNHCVDCNKLIWKPYLRCKSCSQKGILNRKFRNALQCPACKGKKTNKSTYCRNCSFNIRSKKRSIKNNKCFDCKKDISSFATRCKSCSQSGELNPRYGRNPFERVDFRGENHPNWKEDISYKALHSWVNRNKKKPKHCEFCHEEKKLDWASKSHKAKRDLDDYIALCRKCHNQYDELPKKRWTSKYTTI